MLIRENYYDYICIILEKCKDIKCPRTAANYSTISLHKPDLK